MPPVFAHGRLRLYLLKLLDEAPRHGYEVIRQLEQRFDGLYAPSAGTVYPRLAKLEAEGLVTHASEGGRKVYSLTDAGRCELAERRTELTELELEIHESLAALAADIREDVSGSARDLRREMREAARRSRKDGAASARAPRGGGQASSPGPGGGEHDIWRAGREELLRAKEEWEKQTRRAREESRRAKQEVRQAKEQAERAREEAHEEARRIAHRVQEQVQTRARAGDWHGAVRAGMSELAREMGSLGRITGHSTPWPPYFSGRPPAAGCAETDGASGERTGEGTAPEKAATPADTKVPDTRASGAADQNHAAGESAATDSTADSVPESAADAGEPGPEWGREPTAPAADPVRELERLLDRFRDDVRDAARDCGVSEEQLRLTRRQLSTMAAHLVALLRSPEQYRDSGTHPGA